MNRTTLSWMTAALAVCLFVTQGASAAEFHGTLSGTQFPAAVDTNSDGAFANEIVGTGRFTKLGKTSARGLNEVLPWDTSSMCSDTEILLESYFFHMIMTAENGDMLFTEQTDLELCYDVTDNSWDAVHTMDITGGTGRFSGATGSLVCENAGSPLYSPDLDTVGYTWETYCHGNLEDVEGD